MVTDRFLSMYVPGGAEIMHIQNGFFTIDHLTYGWDPVPEPSVFGLAGLAGFVLLLRRRQSPR